MAGYHRDGRARTSVAWEHFEIQDKDRGVATCNHCHDSFSYRTSVSNLMKHLRGKHGYTVLKAEDEVEGTDTELEEKSESKSKVKAEVYQYYELKEDEKQATCSICLEEFTYTSIVDLTKHLKIKHAIEFKNAEDKPEYKSDDEGTDGEKAEMTLQQLADAKSGRRISSAAWEFFEVKDENRKVAACNICGALCSYRTSVSNLMKHARRKHNLGSFRSDEEEAGEDGDNEAGETRTIKRSTPMSRAQRSIVWLYFKCVDPESKLSQCLICKKLLSHSTTLTNLKKHLSRKHPNVKIPAKEDGRKRILLSSGGELYEVEAGSKLDDDDDDDNDNFDDSQAQQHTMEMDTVFIEDFETLEEQPAKKRRLTKTSSKNKKIEYSSSSEEEITFVNRYVKKPSDSFDHFGKYMASLLRKLPKESSSQLQADFVKQIMSVKVEKNDFDSQFLDEQK